MAFSATNASVARSLTLRASSCGWKAKSKSPEALAVGQAAELEGVAEASPLPDPELLLEDEVEELAVAHLRLLGAGDELLGVLGPVGEAQALGVLAAEDITLGYKQLLQVERGWRDMKQVLDLRPVYHRREDRIRAHVVLCWLALLLVRVTETSCGDTWPALRRELEKLKLGSFAGTAGRFRQRTEVTPAQRAILARLELAEPPRMQDLAAASSASS